MGDENLGQAAAAEFLATFIFIFNTCGCALSTAGQPAQLVMVPLTFGLSIFVLVHIFAGTSGANINPAVSAGLVVTGAISPIRCGAYIVAQILGGITAGGLLRGMGYDGNDLCAVSNQRFMNPRQNELYSTGAAFVGEFIMTSLLILAVMAACDGNRKDNKSTHYLAIGMAVALSHFILCPMTNTSINPARSIGTVTFCKTDADDNPPVDDLWIFIVAPMLAGVVMGPLYNAFLAAAEEPEKKPVDNDPAV